MPGTRPGMTRRRFLWLTRTGKRGEVKRPTPPG
jgi:hypothetical protein